jgi:putative MATE family efflux protein
MNKLETMTTAPIPRLIFSLAVPSIISMLITSFYNTADTYFVGKINTEATAAVGINFAVMSIIQALGFFFGQGGGNYISRLLGAQRNEEASTVASTAFFLAFFAGCIVAVFGCLFSSQLAVFMGSTPTILPYAKSYMSIILLGAPVMMAALVMNNQLRFQGSAAYGMVGIVSGGMLNVILDPVLMFIFGMGIAGAAWATIISQAVSLGILLYMSHKGGNLTIHWNKFSPSVERVKEIIAGGAPSLFRQGFGSVGTIVLNVAAGAFGDAAIAAMSIVTRLSFFAGAAMVGFGQGYQPVCGFNYGARIFKRVREGFKFSLEAMFGFTLLISILGNIYADGIIQVFRDDPAVIEIGTWGLKAQTFTFALTSLVVITNMTLQTTRNTRGAIVVAAARRGLFLIPALLVLPRFYGLHGLVWCQPVSDICAFITSFILIKGFFNRLPHEDK